MSFAPRDTHVSQVQFALERGVPAILGIMAENRMPYPARSFDMAHCSRCLIPWAGYGKLLGGWLSPFIYLTWRSFQLIHGIICWSSTCPSYFLRFANLSVI